MRSSLKSFNYAFSSYSESSCPQNLCELDSYARVFNLMAAPQTKPDTLVRVDRSLEGDFASAILREFLETFRTLQHRCYVHFFATIENDFKRLGCLRSYNCHGVLMDDGCLFS